MGFGDDIDLHKFPKGFRQKLAEYYGFKSPQCVLCWSKRKIAIHHHVDHINREVDYTERNAYIWQIQNNYSFDDFSKFVLLCHSCHPKIESAISFGGFIGDKRPPILYLLNNIIKETKEKHGGN